jgi:outer membrane protein OmpA-like peptidoglycan-associated protein
MERPLNLFLIVLFFSTRVISQNLVPNPSFESLRNLPVKKNPKNSFEYEPQSGYIPYMTNLVAWFAATQTTPDLRLYNSEYYKRCSKRYDDCDKPHSGSHSVGIITAMSNAESDTYREYIQVKLKKNLRPHELTHVEFWVTKERQAKWASNNLGCYFSMKKIYKATKGVLDLKPQINIDTIINKEKQQWIKIAGTFLPDKPFEYLLIGNFFDNEHTETFVFKDYHGYPFSPPCAYYLIDDVNVWQDVEEELVFENEIVSSDQPVELKNISFAFDKSELLDSSLQELQKLIVFLNEHPTVKIKIQGHTDALGDEAYNQKLSEDRAKAVYSYLIEQGVDRERLSYEGFGETKPAMKNVEGEWRRINRRVEFVLVDE